MNIFKSKDNFTVAFEATQKTLAQREQIQKLLIAAAEEQKAVAREFEAARAGLDAQEAEFVLSGQTGHTEGSRQMVELSIRQEALAARLRGLDAKLAENATLLLQQESELAAARKEWNRQRVAELMPEYLKAVAAFSAINRKMRALGEALGEQTVISAAQDAAAFSPETGEFILEDAVAGGHPLGWRYLQWDPDWKNDPKAKAIFDANTWPAAIAQQLAGVIGVIRTETRERRIQAQSAAHAASIEKAKERAASGAILVSTYDADGEPTFKHVMPGKATNAA